MIVVSAAWFDCYVAGGYIPTDTPESYEDDDVITDGTRYCVWHRTEKKQ